MFPQYEGRFKGALFGNGRFTVLPAKFCHSPLSPFVQGKGCFRRRRESTPCSCLSFVYGMLMDGSMACSAARMALAS